MASLLTGCWCRMLAKLRDNVLAGVLSVLHLMIMKATGRLKRN